jgi:3-methyladenine DNA glycosylase AlkD
VNTRHGIESFLKHYASPEKAPAMAAYMKNKFEFLGVQSVPRREAMKRFYNIYPLPNSTELPEFCFECFESPYREVHYWAIDVLLKGAYCNTKGAYSTIETLILSHSWWDSVDLLATKGIGRYLKKHPNMVAELIPYYRNHPNIWLVRTAILFQLKYKERTNTALLEGIIMQHCASKEFFIQKAIGWVLREYAKTNKEWVMNGVNRWPLAALSKREALKHLTK